MEASSQTQTLISELQREIIAFKPGEAIQSFDKSMKFPDKLVIGLSVYNDKFNRQTDWKQYVKQAVQGRRFPNEQQTAGDTTSKDFLTKCILIKQHYSETSYGAFASWVARADNPKEIVDAQQIDYQTQRKVQRMLLEAQQVDQEQIEQRIDQHIQRMDKKIQQQKSKALEQPCRDFMQDIDCAVCILSGRYYQDIITSTMDTIRTSKGRCPVVLIETKPNDATSIQDTRRKLADMGVIDILDMTYIEGNCAEGQQLTLLQLIKRCLVISDELTASNYYRDHLNKLMKTLCEHHEVKEVKQNMAKHLEESKKENQKLRDELKGKAHTLKKLDRKCSEAQVEHEENERRLREYGNEQSDSPSKATSQQTASASPSVQQSASRSDDMYSILRDISREISDNNSIRNLGDQLGCIQGDIQRAIQTNTRFNKVTCEGTLDMLLDWRQRVSLKDARSKFWRALVGAKLMYLASKYFPEMQGTPANPIMTGSDRSDSASRTDGNDSDESGH